MLARPHSSSPADDYRRRARRLRLRYARDPAMKLLALRVLGNAHDRQRHRPAIVGHDARDAIREFTDRVTCELTGSRVLRYSRRLALLRRAQRIGINRFDANLMIAAVQNRIPAEPSVVEPPARRDALVAQFGIFAIVQSSIFAAAWIILS